jgi:hypothetical protein
MPLLLSGALQITFEGKLYITDKHACFHAAAEQHDSPSPAAALSSSSSAGTEAGSSSSSGPAGVAKKKRQGRKMPQLTFRIAHADVAAATREPNPARSSSGSRVLASDLLKVVVEPKGSAAPSSSSSSSSGLIKAGVLAAPAAAAGGEGTGYSDRWSVMFQSFEPSSGLDGALALIEHLRDG